MSVVTGDQRGAPIIYQMLQGPAALKDQKPQGVIEQKKEGSIQIFSSKELTNVLQARRIQELEDANAAQRHLIDRYETLLDACQRELDEVKKRHAEEIARIGGVVAQIIGGAYLH